ncbi:MAG TPA: nuclear transport factor 2 family protein, partial [Chitinophagaceae bacterium]|nr:nuclear transport factor 2 family protein [Chitinophagaceae bacterium]
LQMKIEGRNEMVRQIAAYLKNAQTVHQVNHHEIELLTSTNAQAIWSVEDILTFSDPAEAPFTVIHGYGYYHERYEKKAEEWRITGFRLDRPKLDTTPSPAAEHQTA